MNCAAGGPRNIVGPVQDLGGRIVQTVLDQNILEFGFETHARIFFEYLLEHLRRDLIEAETQEIEPRTEMNQGDFARKPRGNSGRGMQPGSFPRPKPCSTSRASTAPQCATSHQPQKCSLRRSTTISSRRKNCCGLFGRKAASNCLSGPGNVWKPPALHIPPACSIGVGQTRRCS